MSIFPTFSIRSKRPGPLDDYWYNTFSPTSKSGISVSESSAFNLSTFAACVQLVAGDIAHLPLDLYQKNRDGSRSKLTDHPSYDIHHVMANDETCAYNFKETTQCHLMTWGNTYSEITYDRAMRARKLWQFDNPESMAVKRNGKGDIVYCYQPPEGKPIEYPAYKIFHIPGFGFNGLVGKSPIGYLREVIGLGLAAEQFGAMYFGEGTHPSGIISMPDAAARLGTAELKKYADYVKKAYGGLEKSSGVMVLGMGEKYQPFTVPLNDAQFLETRQFQDLKICGFFRVPPHKVGIHGPNSNYNNLEQENQNYVNSCLIHWGTRRSQNATLQLLTKKERARGLYFEYNWNALLAGDSQARGEFYQKLNNMGYPLNTNHEKENENPVEGGDESFIQINMATMKSIANESFGQPAESNNARNQERRDTRETRSIRARDRVTKRHEPLVRRAVDDLVKYEVNALRKQVKKWNNRDAIGAMTEWLDDFYRSFRKRIADDMGPVFRAFAESLSDVVADEIGVDQDDIDITQFVKDYIDVYSKKHAGRSEGQLMALLDENLDDLEQRLDEWEEKRTEKIVGEETARLDNAVYGAIAFMYGYSVSWNIRGDACIFCKSLRGKVISRSGSFIKGAGTLKPKDADTPLKIGGKITHPPLHRGCKCYIAIGI